MTRSEPETKQENETPSLQAALNSLKSSITESKKEIVRLKTKSEKSLNGSSMKILLDEQSNIRSLKGDLKHLKEKKAALNRQLEHTVKKTNKLKTKNAALAQKIDQLTEFLKITPVLPIEEGPAPLIFSTQYQTLQLEAERQQTQILMARQMLKEKNQLLESILRQKEQAEAEMRARQDKNTAENAQLASEVEQLIEVISQLEQNKWAVVADISTLSQELKQIYQAQATIDAINDQIYCNRSDQMQQLYCLLDPSHQIKMHPF